MSVVSPGAGESFIVRVWKSLTTNPAVRWANTYECRFNAAGSEANLITFANRCVDFEIALAVETSYFLYYTISTWLPDSHPYNPDAFVSVPINGPGARGVGSNHLVDLRITFLINRIVSSGFSGKLELRNSLFNEEL